MGEFPWEALATLVTGILAVGAAAVVAVKQNNIVKRQVKLQELLFRNETFERRMTVYRSLKRYLWQMTSATTIEDEYWSAWNAYREALQEVQFLFSKKVFLELNALDMTLQEAMEYLLTLSRPDITLDDRAFYQALLHKRQSELRKQIRRFPSLFDREMNLRDREETYEEYLADEQLPDIVETIDDVAAAARQQLNQRQNDKAKNHAAAAPRKSAANRLPG